jgi:hypothetical protein
LLFGKFYRRRLNSERISSITILSGAGLPSAEFSRCSWSDALSEAMQTRATLAFSPTAVNAARRLRRYLTNRDLTVHAAFEHPWMRYANYFVGHR